MSGTDLVETPAADETGLLGWKKRQDGRLARWSRKHATEIRTWETRVHFLVLAFIGILLVFGTQALGNMDVSKCDQVTNSGPRGLILAGAAIVGAFGGRFAARIRFEARQKLYRQVPKDLAVPAWVHVGIFLFLVTATALLIYETWALAHNNNPPPITSYVRCAAYWQPLWAPVTALFTGFLLTNWLWYPTK
jgi:hypothetical protein